MTNPVLIRNLLFGEGWKIKAGEAFNDEVYCKEGHEDLCIETLSQMDFSEIMDAVKNSKIETTPCDPNKSETYKDRLLDETRQVTSNLNKLNAFMASDVFPTLDQVEKDLFYTQQRTMSKLVQTLGKRLAYSSIQLFNFLMKRTNYEDTV